MMKPADPSRALFQPTHGPNNSPLPTRLLRQATKFVKLIKEYNNGEVFHRFLQIVKDYVEQRIDAGAAMSRIDKLVEDHSELRQGVMNHRKEVKLANFIQKVEGRLPMSECIRFYVIIEGYRSRQRNMVNTIKAVTVLFANNRDLLADFLGFLPSGFNLSE